MDLQELTYSVRKRLLEFRQANLNEEISIHINAIDIAVSLTELSIKQKPIRQISKEEEWWFKAGFYISIVLENSEWSDLYVLYCKLVEEVEKRNYFRQE